MNIRHFRECERNVPVAALLTFSFVASAAAQNGAWIGTTDFETWSNTANWQNGIVANGAGNTADFSTIDLPDTGFPLTIGLDTPRTIGNFIFGDTNTSTASGWLIDDNLDAANVLTLAGSPVITVNALGEFASAEISTVIAGTAGLTKNGSGELTLSGENIYSGTTQLQAGRLNVNSATAIGTGPLVVSGGSLGHTAGGVALTNNNPQTWNTDVLFHGPSNLDMGAGSVTSAVAREITTDAGILTWGGAVDMPGFTKSGAGELLLTGNNTAGLFGDITLREGIVRLGGGSGNGQNAIGSPANMITFEGGAIAVNGSTGTNQPNYAAFTNPMFVDAGQSGTLYHSQRSTGGNALSAPLTGSGTFNLVVNFVRGEVNADWSGFTGQINAIAGGGGSQLRLNGTNHFANAKLHLGPGVYMHQVFNPPNNAVGTTHDIGELSGDVGAIVAGHPVAGRFVNWSVGALNTDPTFAGVIEATPGTWGLGGPRLYKVGTGTLTLTGTNTYTGETEINAGTLQIGDGGATGSLGNTNVTVASGANLVFNRDDTSTYPGILAGAGNIIKRGSGTVNFDSANSYSTGTLIEGGRIGINSNASLGLESAPVTFAVSNGGILATAPDIASSRTFDIASGITATIGSATAADSFTVGGTVSGAGALAVDGAGIVRLSAANTYGGNTTVNSGTLAAANTTGSATSTGPVTVNGGALAGAGTIAGAVTVGAASEIKPGAVTTTSSSIGDLTVGSLALAGGAEIFVELAGGSNDRLVVTSPGGLTSSAHAGNPVLVDLRQENSTAKWITPGTFPIIQFSGTFAGDVDFSNGVLTFANRGLGTGGLVLDNATLAWQGGNTQDISNRTIVFGDDPVTFAMDGNVTLANNFGGAGAANLAKEGFGTLTLAADTTFPGDIEVRDGSLALGSGGANGSVVGDIALTGFNTLLRVNRSTPLEMTNLISGVGDLRISGGGTITLNNENTFSGFTNIDAGSTLALLDPFALQNSTLEYESTGGNLDIDALFSLRLGGLEGDKDLALLSGGFGLPLEVGRNDMSTFYDGTLSGQGSSLTKTGAGFLTLGAPQLYDSFTAVNAGTLEFATGSSVSTTSANVTGGGRLLINGGILAASANTSIAPGGANGLHILGGSATFNAALTDTNNDGGLILVDGGALTAASMSFGRTQIYGNAADPAPMAVGDGTGLVVRSGTAEILGDLTIGTSNSSASSLVDGGDLTVGGLVNIGSTTNTRWSRLEVRNGNFTVSSTEGIILSPHPTTGNRSQFYVTGGVSNVERIAFGAPGSASEAIGRLTVDDIGTLYVGAGGLVEESTNFFTPQIQLFGGTLAASADWTTDIDVVTANLFEIKTANASSNPFDITFEGTVSGTGSLVKSGGGNLTLAQGSFHSGDTFIDEGTLTMNFADFNDTAAVEIASGATLHLPHGEQDLVGELRINGILLDPGEYDSASHPGSITGSGSLVVVDAPYLGWIADFPSLSGADAEMSADPDDDGLTNLEEFAFDSDPTSGAASEKFRAGVRDVNGDDVLVITVPVRQGAVFSGAPALTAVVDGVIYTIRGSNDLLTFDQGAVEIPADAAGLPATSQGWEYRSFRLTGAIGGAGSRGPRGFLAAGAGPAE